MSVPLKLKDSADLQEFSTTEENYLAYQLGLELSDGYGIGSLLDSDASGRVNIGSIVDTSYNQNVDDGGNDLVFTFSTVTSNLYQDANTASLVDSDQRPLIRQYDDNGQRKLQALNTSQYNTLIDRLNSRIFTSDYPGSYKLSTTAPSGDYTERFTLGTDTRADGASIAHKIWQRTSMTAPTTVRPFALKRANGLTGTYQGLQLLTDRQIKKSLSNYSRNRIASGNDGGTGTTVGSYRILSSSVGTPANAGYSGTWVSKGTATDTRNTIVAQNYTRGRTSNYNRQVVTDYTRVRATSYTGGYNRNFITNYTRTSVGTYQQIRSSMYTLSFIGDYIANFTVTRTSTYVRTSQTVLDYVSTSTRSRSSTYTRLENYLGTQGTGEGNYARTVTSTRNFTGDFAGNYTRFGDYIGNYSRNFLGNLDSNIQKDSATNYTGNFVGNYGRNFSDDYARNFTRSSTTDFTGNYARNYTGDYTGNYARNFLGNYVGEGEFVRSSIGTQNYIGDFLTNDNALYNFTRTSTRTLSYLGNFIGGDVEYVGDYARVAKGGSIFYISVSSDYQRTRSSSYTSNSQRTSTRNFSADYTGNFTGNYQGEFTGNYQGEFLGEYASDFLGGDGYSRNFTGNFSRNYSGNYARTTKVSTYLGDYTGNFQGNYLKISTATSTRNFTGNYAGTKLSSGTETIKTYTLYVRTD